jgi:hypothetical protein
MELSLITNADCEGDTFRISFDSGAAGPPAGSLVYSTLSDFVKLACLAGIQYR